MASIPAPQITTLAPATWAVNYRLGGFDCVLTLAGDNGSDLLQRAGAALAWLQSAGAQPAHQPTPAPVLAAPANGNGAHQVPQPAPVPTLGNGLPDPAWCPIHNVTMSRRERDGQVWYSHKDPSGAYCKGSNK